MLDISKQNDTDFLDNNVNDTLTLTKIVTEENKLFNNKDLVVNRGQIDESRPGNNLPSNGEDLKNAMDCLLLGTKNYKKQKPSIGCNIKWKE